MSSSTALRLVKPMDRASYVTPATVIEARGDRVEVSVHGVAVWAEIAVAPLPSLAAGDRVLVTGEDLEGCYVIGVLGAAKGARAQEIVTQSGARAVVTNEGAERIEVRDHRDQLLFSYQPETGQGTLSMPEGDLTLHAPRGDIALQSGGVIRCRGQGGVALSSGASSMVMGPNQVGLTSDELALSGARAEILFGEARYKGATLTATIESVRVVAKKVERVVVWLFERAKSVFRRVDDLDQLEAGRTRTIVDGTHFMKGKRTIIEAEEDVKLDGRKIHLG